jgi:hypothetical protein
VDWHSAKNLPLVPTLRRGQGVPVSRPFPAPCKPFSGFPAGTVAAWGRAGRFVVLLARWQFPRGIGPRAQVAAKRRRNIQRPCPFGFCLIISGQISPPEAFKNGCERSELRFPTASPVGAVAGFPQKAPANYRDSYRILYTDRNHHFTHLRNHHFTHGKPVFCGKLGTTISPITTWLAHRLFPHEKSRTACAARLPRGAMSHIRLSGGRCPGQWKGWKGC